MMPPESTHAPQVHWPARLLVVLAGFPPCAVAAVVATAYPPVFWLVPLQLVPYICLLWQRDPEGFLIFAIVAAVICLVEGLMFLIVGVVFALPTALLLALAVASTKRPSTLWRNVPALAGLCFAGVLALLITTSTR
ncbi:hypothetical protein [Yinghuangia soli]|uniref:Uncharacterized protein n=1 Tax=Yinghuangia soli TaxID=2908204 RepID=A0AA41Q3H7_9ACTN|nr:hypothetical protein [Yinghuangia soli]MCF2530542.1 hypothetical protein [Yinghuangia soli]